MPISPVTLDREHDKFEETVAGKTAVRTIVSGVGIPGGIATETTLLAIKTELESIKGFVDELEGFTDGLEALNQQILNSVDGLEGFTDGIEPALSGLQTTLTAISGFVDQLEGLSDEVEPKLEDIKIKLDTLITRQLLLSGSGVEGAITVGTVAVEAKVGASPLAGRKLLTIQPRGDNVFWGRTASVTTATGTELFRDVVTSIAVDATAPVFLIGASGTVDTRLTESK